MVQCTVDINQILLLHSAMAATDNSLKFNRLYIIQYFTNLAVPCVEHSIKIV